jgi:hypothetical protein
MPAFGLASVPLPTKNRRIDPGYQPAIVAADGDPTAAADRPLTNSPVDTDAAGAAVRAAPPNSRRDAAATVHANGAADGLSPEPPEANHANRFELTPRTPLVAAAARGAVITGADAAAGAATAAGATTTATSGAATESSTTGGAESLPPTGATTEPRDGTDTTAPRLTPTPPGATTAPDRRSCALPAGDPGLTPPPRLPESAVPGASLSDEPLPADAVPDDAPRPARAGPRDGAFVDSDAADPEPAESAELDPDDPPDPVVSANATGTDATAEPTPRATANAPTRPTNGAKLDDPTSVAITARRPYSIARTRPPETRR